MRLRESWWRSITDWRGRFGIFEFWILWFLEMAGDEKTALPEGRAV